MKPRTFLMAAVAAALCMFVAAGLWHNLVLPAMDANKQAHHDGLGLMLVAYLVLATLMTYLYARTSNGKRPAWDGVVMGVVIGVLWVFPHELALAGAHGDSLAYVFKNGAWHVVEQGLGGWVLGLVWGKQALH